MSRRHFILPSGEVVSGNDEYKQIDHFPEENRRVGLGLDDGPPLGMVKEETIVADLHLYHQEHGSFQIGISKKAHPAIRIMKCVIVDQAKRIQDQHDDIGDITNRLVAYRAAGFWKRLRYLFWPKKFELELV